MAIEEEQLYWDDVKRRWMVRARPASTEQIAAMAADAQPFKVVVWEEIESRHPGALLWPGRWRWAVIYAGDATPRDQGYGLPSKEEAYRDAETVAKREIAKAGQSGDG